MKIVKHLTTVQKYPDLQVHVRVIEADGAQFVDIRDYVPSAEQYGRGIMLPAEKGLLMNVADGLRDVQEGRA